MPHLSAIQSLAPDRPSVESTCHQELKVCEYSLIAFDSVASGMFMKMTGVLAAKGLRMLDARIVTRPDGIVVDTFWVKDPDFHDAPTPARLGKVGGDCQCVEGRTLNRNVHETESTRVIS